MKYARDRLRLETDYQRDIVAFYKALGCAVQETPRGRRNGTWCTPGIADLKVYAPRVGKSWWHEVKTPEGEQSDAQKGFEQLVTSCGEIYLLGGLNAAIRYSVDVGLVTTGPLELLRGLMDPIRRLRVGRGAAGLLLTIWSDGTPHGFSVAVPFPHQHSVHAQP